MDRKNKDNAKKEFIEMIMKSWTYGRLTEKEREHLHKVFEDIKLFGSFRQRWEIMQNVYSGFLYALGFCENFANWRGTDTEPLF